MNLFSKVMKRLVYIYIYALQLNYVTLDYHIIELLCCHYNGSVGVSFFTSKTIGPSDYRADTSPVC
jgi:hypothetical protein